MQISRNSFKFLGIIFLAGFFNLAQAQDIKDQPKLDSFTRADLNIPSKADAKIPLDKKQVEDLLAKLNSYKSSLKGIVVNAGAISKGEIKDIKHKGIKNILSLEFLKLKTKNSKSFLILELNSFKIGKMPFNAYAELEIPIENIFKDAQGFIYIDYSIDAKLKEKNFIKVMGAKSRINQFSFKYLPNDDRVEFFIYAKDKIPMMSETVEMSMFGKGKIL